MPITKPVVFISSTAKDLIAHRDAAAKAARQSGFEDVRMEDFEAQSLNPPYAACMEKVRECDVLVVIVADRYGWVPEDQPDNQAKSITWLECEEMLREAKEKPSKEVLAFVVDQDYKWPVEFNEAYRATEALLKGALTPGLLTEIKRNVKKLDEFKAWLDSHGFRRKFTDAPNLNSEVQDSLNKWRQRHDRVPQTPPPTHDDPAEYLRQLRELTRWIDIRGLQVGAGKAYRFPIGDLYIPLSAAGADPVGNFRGEAGADPGRIPLEDALRHQRLVIEGDPGAGKTTFLRRIAFEMCRDDGQSSFALPVETRPPNGFPLYLRIADLDEHIGNCRRHTQAGAPTTDHSPQWLAHCLAAQAADRGWNLNAAFFTDRLNRPGTILLLDGLDESPNTRRREIVARMLEEAVTAFPNCRFVVTTRPLSYTGPARLPGFAEVRIDELQPDAIEAFLGHWSRCLFPGDERSAREHLRTLAEALHARPAIRGMARNPVMLTALAVVHWNERRLPEQRADLYSSIAGWLARARESRPGRASSDLVLTLLGHLALGMQNQPKGRIPQISKAAAADIVAPQFREIADPNLRLERARAFLADEEVDSGIFISRGPDLRFWHLTLQEFLAARTIAGLTDESQRELLFEGERLYRPEWREVMLLLGGVLIGQGASKVDGLFGAMLQRVDPSARLAEKARCAGLIGAMMRDLQPYSYSLADPSYQRMLREALDIFDREKSQGIDLKVRLAAAEALGQAGDPRLRLPKNDDYWVSIPAGKFVMGEGKGDEEHEHEVYLDAFQIGRYPVTAYEYGVFLEDAEHKPPEEWEEQSLHPNRPVVNVTWFDAEAYCQWAAAKTKGVRLPTEAEWERAARGATGRRYAWGNAKPNPDLANYNEARIGSPSPVGLFPRGSTPAPENIADLTGNVWEWVSDWYDASYYKNSPRENPKGPNSREGKVLRGGSWGLDSTYLRAADRIRNRPGFRLVSFGFRCVREVVLP